MQKKHSRNMFFTPQSRKILSPASRLSISSHDRNPEHLLGSLLKDPIKRALLMEVLSKDKPKEDVSKDQKSWKKPIQHRFKFESPSSLCRRRALEKMCQNSDSSDSINANYEHPAKKVPFEQVLKGVVAYIEIMSNNKDRSAGAKALMRAMGADVKDTITRDVTHVVFKDGSFRTYQKAKLLKVHVVSVLWIEAVRKNMYRVPEQKYPALGTDASDLDASLICQQFQHDYADVIQDELNRSKNLNIQSKANPLESYSPDVVNASQSCDFNSITTDLKNKQETPESLYLDTSPELTSDSEPEYHSKRRVSTRLFKHKRPSKSNITRRITEGDNKKGAGDEIVDKIDRADEIETRFVNLSSLHITSTNSNEVKKTITPLEQRTLNYNNVTERKKRPENSNKITILENVIISSPDKDKNTDRTKSFQELLVKRIYSDEVNNENSPLPVKKKTARRLYNVDDPITFGEESVDVVNSGNNNRNSNSNATVTNVIENKNVKKEILPTPIRKSARLIQNKSSESFPKVAGSKNDAETADDCSNESNLVKGKRSIFRKQTKVDKLSDSDEEFENRPNLTPPKREKTELKDDLPPTSTPKTLKPTTIASTSTSANNASSPKRKIETAVSKPVPDSCDEFVQPDPGNTEKAKETLPKAPTRRSTRLLSVKSTRENDISPAQRRSTRDFIPKIQFSATNRTRINSYLKNGKAKSCSIVCTRFHSSEVQVFHQIVRKLGVFFYEDEVSEKTTHLVAAQPRRTVNLLRAIARGCWVLKSEWLYRSLEAGCWIAEEEYELVEFSVAVQKARQERQAFGPRFSLDIFQNSGKIYISKRSNPRCSDLQELVTLCKGSITLITRNADIVVGEYAQDKSCVTESWIMDSITFYKRKSLRNYIIPPPDSD